MTDIFHQIAGNEVPDRAVGGFLSASGGTKLRYGHFETDVRPHKGTIILLNGRNECIEKYFETVRDLTRRGFAVATMDWRGQGGSDRARRMLGRGHIHSFNDYVVDLEQFFQEVVLPDCRGPFYILAHSTGALIALLASPSLTNRVRRMVLLAPFLTYAGSTLSPQSIRRVAKLLTWLYLGRMYGLGRPRRTALPFERNILTSDPVRYERNVRLYETFPQLATGGPTVAWIRAAFEAVRTVSDPAFMAAVKVPILFVAAGFDQVVSTRAIDTYAKGMRAGSLLTIDGAQHEILQEADRFREQFFAAFDAFVPGSGEYV